MKEIYAKFNCVEDVERKIKTDLYGVSVTELSSINKKIAFCSLIRHGHALGMQMKEN